MADMPTSIVVDLAANQLGNFALSDATNDISRPVHDSAILLHRCDLESGEWAIGTLLAASNDTSLANDLSIIGPDLALTVNLAAHETFDVALDNFTEDCSVLVDNFALLIDCLALK
jgi:hypothetical protein